MKAIDGSLAIRAREGDSWPRDAICDLGVVSNMGPSAAVYLTLEQVHLLISRLLEQVPDDVLSPDPEKAQSAC